MRDAISAPPRKVTPPQCMRAAARVGGGLTARKICGCGRARRVGYGGYGGYGGYVVSAARRRGDERDASRRGLRAVSAVSRIDAAMRRACGHARRADLSSRAGGVAALGLPAHVPPRPAYLLSCWVPGYGGDDGSALRRAGERAAARQNS